MEDVAVLKILKDLYNSFKSYFKALTVFGYKKQSDVDKLILYTFIIEILTSEMRNFVTAADYREMEILLYHLYGTSCLMPYPKLCSHAQLFGYVEDGSMFIPRITEDGVIRYTQTDNVRYKANNYEQ